MKRSFLFVPEVKKKEHNAGKNAETDNQKPGAAVAVPGKEKTCENGPEKLSGAAGEFVQCHAAPLVGFGTLIGNIDSGTGGDKDFSGGPDYGCTLKQKGVFGKNIDGKACSIQE